MLFTGGHFKQLFCGYKPDDDVRLQRASLERLSCGSGRRYVQALSGLQEVFLPEEMVTLCWDVSFRWLV